MKSNSTLQCGAWSGVQLPPNMKLRICWLAVGIKHSITLIAKEKEGKNLVKDIYHAIPYQLTSITLANTLWWLELTKRFLFILETWDILAIWQLSKTGLGVLNSDLNLNNWQWLQTQGPLLSISLRRRTFSVVIVSYTQEGITLQM